MAAYATVEDIQARMEKTLSEAEQDICTALLEDAAVIIDAVSSGAREDAKRVVSCRMVLRAMSDSGGSGVPMGAMQGSVAALGYSQSWTMGSGTAGELYLSKLEKGMLGIGDQIGAYSPVEDVTVSSEEAS